MEANQSVKSAILALIVVIIAIGSWELYLRVQYDYICRLIQNSF